jgi:RNA polymerase sigma-70 factor, ECF subfamily
MTEQMDKNNAAELMRLAIAGDKNAFSSIYEQYFSPVYRYIYFRVQSKVVAEDIAQAVFLKVWEKLPDYQDLKRPPLAYFFTIARNKVIDHWRQNKRVELFAEENDLDKIPDAAKTAEEIVSRGLAMEEISRVLEKISSDQQEVIILKFINELSYLEIARILRKNETAIRKIASRGLENLRKHFKL